MDTQVFRTCERIGGCRLMRRVLAAAVSVLVVGSLYPAFGQNQQSVPNAPTPQPSQTEAAPPDAPEPGAASTSLSGLKDQVAPGKGAGVADQQIMKDAGQPPQMGGQANPTGQEPAGPDQFQKAPPEIATPGQGAVPTFRVSTTYVDVPVTVRHKNGSLVAGLPWWRFRVYEDGVRQRIAFFSTDAQPLSIAFVVDATLPSDVMQKVNRSLAAVTGVLTPSDSVAVITYAATSPQLITSFTAAQGARLPAALEMAKRPGQSMGVPMVDGPFAAGPTINGEPADPTLTLQRGNSGPLVLPKETHPLNDAILFAAEQLASQPRGRRRIVYVVSDGRNLRSKASFKEVVQYLLTNNISVYGTQVGESAIWGIGYLDRLKLPLLQPEDILPKFALATGGDVDAEMSENGIQNAFARITASVRTAYTIGYISHQPTISGKYHSIDVHVEGLSGLVVDAKQGYYPSANMAQ
jgi:VWFA-related protein